jgi:hypothetical protein
MPRLHDVPGQILEGIVKLSSFDAWKSIAVVAGVLIVAVVNHGSDAYGQAKALFLEASPLQSASPSAPARITQTQISGADTIAQVFAVLRDSLGNYVGTSTSTTWTSRDSAVAIASSGNSAQGQGIIIRRTSASSSVWISGSYLGMRDSVMVLVGAVTYDSLQIYVLSGGVSLISGMTIRTDQDTTLYARGKRADNGNWEDVSVRWTSPCVALNPDSLASAPAFWFRPSLAGSGLVVADRSGTGGIVIRDTVAMTINSGLPFWLVLFRNVGAPDPADPTNTAYPNPPSADTIWAGQSITLSAKLFDRNGVWLSAYESSPGNQTIIWRIVEQAGNNLPPTGYLSSTQGNVTTFTATRAYSRADIVAEYNESARQASDIVRFYVVPDTAFRLVIEPSFAPSGIYLNQANKLAEVIFSSRDRQQYAYAVLRDRFGNYVSPSTATDWGSLDTTIVSAHEGTSGAGEGVVLRVGYSGAANVVAADHDKPFLIDTVQVVLVALAYDSLRIVVGDSTRIEDLTVRTDQDTTITVQGKRSDNAHWEPVLGNWSITPALLTTPGAPSASSSWAFMPRDTGSGIIVASVGSAVSDTITVQFISLATHVGGSHVVRLPGIVRFGNRQFVTPSDARKIVFDVFDCRGKWVRRIAYDLASSSGVSSQSTRPVSAPIAALVKVCWEDANGRAHSMKPTTCILVK